MAVLDLPFFAFEVEDGWMVWVTSKLAEVATSAGKVQGLFGDVVSQVGKLCILPAFLLSCLSPLLQKRKC